jgi:hypothetical protein
MMAKFRLEIDVAGFNATRNDPAIQAKLDAMGEAIAAQANAATGGSADFIAVPSPNATRARTVVVTATSAGKRAEAKDRVLSTAFDAARG